jgi:hypothetical protein
VLSITEAGGSNNGNLTINTAGIIPSKSGYYRIRSQPENYGKRSKGLGDPAIGGTELLSKFDEYANKGEAAASFKKWAASLPIAEKADW